MIPVLMLIVFLEWKYSKKDNREIFRFESTVLNICCGIIERSFDLFILLGTYLLFQFVHTNFSLFIINDAYLINWLICLFAVEFMIYWYHRAGHSVNFLWAAHVTHHQCEEFNYTVAFRNHFLPNVFRAFWLGLLAIIGFQAEMIMLSVIISGLWQFLLHTTLIDRLGFLEHFMTTPSAHRVHHGINEEYLDKNFGGMLIIWDKIFGTYAIEKAEVKYGITTTFTSIDPIEAYTHVWSDLIKVHKKVNSLKEKMSIWFGTPEYFYNKYKNQLNRSSKPTVVNLTPSLVYYITLQLVVMIVLLMVVMAFEDFFTATHLFILASFLIFSAISVCKLMENNQLAFSLEKIRCLMMFPLITNFITPHSLLMVLLLLLTTINFIMLIYMEWDTQKIFAKKIER